MPSLSSSRGRLARRRSLLAAACAAPLFLAPALPALTVDFGDVSLSTPPAQSGFGGVYYNGSDGAGGFTSGGVHFGNHYDNTYDSWDGFSYSTTNDTANGYPNQYSAFSPANTGAYAVAFAGYATPATITFASPVALQSVSVTNTTYAALDMLNGGLFGSKKFGGVSGNDPDFFSVTFNGYDASHTLTGAVTFYLADFRFANNTLDYVVNDWTTVDLSGLGIDVTTIELSFDSSDVGMYGINTPLYVALDNLVIASAIPEPATCASLAGITLLGLAALRRRRALRA